MFDMTAYIITQSSFLVKYIPAAGPRGVLRESPRCGIIGLLIERRPVMHKFALSDGKERCRACIENQQNGADNGCVSHRHLPAVVSLEEFFGMVRDEIYRARLLYRGHGVMNALTEEVGELAAAYSDEPREHIVREAVQVCAMAIRSALEGDPLLAPYRAERGLDP
jgi:hypothetical protein